MRLNHTKGGNSFPKFNVGGGEHWAVRSLMIIDYWSRGPEATFFWIPPLFAFFKELESVSL